MIPHATKPMSELQDGDSEFEFDRTRQVKWYDHILLNRPLKVSIALLLLAIVTPVLVYQFVFFNSIDLPPSDGYSVGSCLVPRTARLLCGIGNVTSDQCHVQCCYDFTSNTCFHRYPSRFSYLMDREWNERISLMPRVSTVPFSSQSSLTRIRLSIDEVSSTHLTLNFYNAAEEIIVGKKLNKKDYVYTIASPELNVVVNSSQGIIFNTIRGPLIASENIWETAFKLTNESMYGFGELPLKENTVKVIYSHKEGTSSIPLIFAKSNNSYHGILIDAMSPTVVSFGTENQIVIRSITSLGLKFHLFVGPTPADVMKDVTKLLGKNKQLEYWTLGAHVCTHSSNNTLAQAITELAAFLTAANRQNVPFDSHCGAAPIQFESECNTDRVTRINDGARRLRAALKRFVPHVSPHIYYKVNETVEEIESKENETELQNRSDEPCFDIENYRSCLLHDSDASDIYYGVIGNRSTVYPIYEKCTESVETLWRYDSNVNGIVLENTWPLDESEKNFDNIYSRLPYFNQDFEDVFQHVPKWNAIRPDNQRYMDKHNEYGNHFVDAFMEFGNSTIWASSQWLRRDIIINRQNVPTSWSNLQRELVHAALGGISGHWYWSSPICGDTDSFDIDTHASLCVKWYMAAAFMPLVKIHSIDTYRDPITFTGTQRNITINALRFRSSLLPYFFTVLQNGPLLRPMFYQFPDSERLQDLSTQFSVGNNLLIVPNLQPSQSHVHVWLPPGTWYEFLSGMKIEGEEGSAVTMTTTEADFLTLVCGGSIIVMQKDVRLNAELTRIRSQYSLVISLDCTIINNTKENNSTKECSAHGQLYMSPNMTIIFKANEEKLIMSAEGDDFDVFCDTASATWANVIRDISIFGLHEDMNNFDHHKESIVNINLCGLQNESELNELVYEFAPLL